MYTWIAYESNAFDGMDEQYINALGGNDSGRFVPCWGKSSNKLIFELCEEYEENPYYVVPKRTKNSFLTDPATYTLDGKSVTTVTFAEPIIIDSEFLGVAGIDISLEQLTLINSNVKLFENGFGKLVNSNGIVLAHPGEYKLDKVDAELEGESGLKQLEKIKIGEVKRDLGFSEDLGQDAYKFYMLCS
ncbi:cache domain-containing protein [Peptoclostridium litorale]|nr:cache domain-containing protein [Peptoclostridium litorale]